MRCVVSIYLVSCLIIGLVNAASGDEAAALRLIPFPKKIELQKGEFPLNQKFVLEVPAASADLLGSLIGEELQRADLPAPEVRTVAGDTQFLRLSTNPGVAPSVPVFREQATPEDYVLNVQPGSVDCVAPGDIGLVYATQTLCQLIRANRRGQTLPCASIRDWPSLPWRGLQDDMTRGPSAHLDTLKREVDLGASLKMNLLTYYMEYQFAFAKHPLIGPKDGSLTPEELKALVAYAKSQRVDILGSQQSFAHFGNILKHPEYAAYRETGDILSPVNEESYRLLDDLYSEVVPLLPFPWFSVCCDETQGLGTGPSKELVEKIGVDGVYVQHIRRLHDLLKDKYNKRMVMWGDIILEHPDKLDQIPKDTIMLTWAYDARPSYESQILPFAKSGYEFFVCPGVDDWGRILPGFGNATENIRNFVRDGAKHKTLGVLNTEWKDDGETLRATAWHGYAWGAECAWNASTTELEDFNRRIGAVLFGEKGDHFGQAVKLLAHVHDLPVAGAEDAPGYMPGMTSVRFWKQDFAPTANEAAVRALADPLLALVRPAIEHLEACKKDAVINADLLDGFLYGARRMELIGQRMLDGLEAARTYADAIQAVRRDEKLAKLATVEQLVRRNRDAHETLGKEFARLWHVENKPYSLDLTMKRYTDLVNWYEEMAMKLADIRKQVEAGKPLPAPDVLRLVIPAAQ